MPAGTMQFRWLGTAGMEFTAGGERLLVDPYLSRFPMRNLFFGRPRPKEEVIRRMLLPSRAALITHAHFDHLVDVPSICRMMGSAAYGSAHACRILEACGVPPESVREVHAGDHFSIGPFSVDVFSGVHGRIMGILPYTGPLRRDLRPSLRLSDYRIDSVFSFRVEAAGTSGLIWNNSDARNAPRADILFFCPLWGAQACAEVARAANVRSIVPIHWDNYFSPLDRSIGPILAPPGWHSPWIRRMDPEGFARKMSTLCPEVAVIIPQAFKMVNVGDW